MTSGKPAGSTATSASASALSSCSRMSRCSVVTPWAAIPCAISSAGSAIASPARPSAKKPTTASAASTAATCFSPGAACSWSCSAICTGACVRWVSGPISGFSRTRFGVRQRTASAVPKSFLKSGVLTPAGLEDFLVPDYITHDHDVLIIGAGGAGLRAAVAASASGAKVAVVSKSLLGKAHTVMAEGGMAAAMGNVDDRDGWRVHFADTMRGGQYLNNWRMAELHAKEAPERVRELEAWGAMFDRTKEGKISQRNFGGHRYPRLAHVGDRTGLEMIRTLQDHGIHQGITVHMEWTIVTLLKDGDRIAGAFGYDRERGRFKIFQAKAVVIASGGLGRAYKITSNSWEGTGDGHSLAYHAGAELMDMEFIQFHPTGMIWPPSVQGLLVTESVRGEGGVLRNKDGKRFMFDDIPDNYKSQTSTDPEEGWRYTQNDKNARRPPKLLTRDHVARCITREVKAGRGSPHGGVFLDISWIKEKLPNAPEHIKKKLPSMYQQFKQLADIDITQEPMEVGPTTHYAMGGIRVNGDTQATNVPGLFAAGECAAGLHGANRLGGNSLSDLIVVR